MFAGEAWFPYASDVFAAENKGKALAAVSCGGTKELSHADEETKKFFELHNHELSTHVDDLETFHLKIHRIPGKSLEHSVELHVSDHVGSPEAVAVQITKADGRTQQYLLTYLRYTDISRGQSEQRVDGKSPRKRRTIG